MEKSFLGFLLSDLLNVDRETANKVILVFYDVDVSDMTMEEVKNLILEEI